MNACKHAQIVGDVQQTAERQDHEPDDHDRAEKPRHPIRAARLHPEQDAKDQDDTGMTAFSSCGATSLRPSTAESTEIAGVMTASP